MSEINLQQCIEKAGYKTRSYSGRGMFGKECLGVVIGNSVISFIVELMASIYDYDPAVGIGDAVFLQIKSAKTDSMGKDTIVYFPGAEYDGIYSY